ncbi:MAG: hypothetical protein M3R13_05355 [Armatimonadota bacterium]|nr:hypothetical protein [Armatimonadota bacterium]
MARLVRSGDVELPVQMRTARGMKFVCGAAASLLALPLLAGWEVTVLETEYSSALSVRGAEVVGSVRVGSRDHASIFGSSPGSWIDLTPPAFIRAVCNGTDGTRQVGYVLAPGATSPRASLWSGTVGSWVDLGEGAAAAIDGDIQVGGVSSTACLWRGSVQSRVILEPIGASNSAALGVSGNEQVGYVGIQGAERASLWRGTRESWRDLHPQWALSSYAHGTHGGQQVGYTISEGPINDLVRACVWTGTRESWRSLHPAWSELSGCNGVDEGRQVGSFMEPVTGSNHASMWSGTIESMEDLHQYLPPEYQGFASGSSAHGIDVNQNGLVRIVGRADEDAVIWTRQFDLIYATTMSVQPGVLISGNLVSLQNSDDDKLRASPGIVFSISVPPVQVTVEGTSPSSDPASLDFVFDGAVSSPSVEHSIQFYNFESGQFETLYQRFGSTVDTYALASATGDVSRFVEPGTRRVRAKMTYRVLAPVFAYPWRVEIDRGIWMISQD